MLGPSANVLSPPPFFVATRSKQANNAPCPVLGIVVSPIRKERKSQVTPEFFSLFHFFLVFLPTPISPYHPCSLLSKRKSKRQSMPKESRMPCGCLRTRNASIAPPSPFFVNITLQTVVCARCSGLIREVGHRVKSISASTFTGPEAMALELGGNGIAAKIWLAGYNAQHSTPEPESDDDVRAFMRQKYFEQKWFDQELWHSQDEYIKRRIDECFTEDGELKPSARQQRRASSGPSGAPLLKPLPSSPTSTSPLSTSPPIRRVPAPLNLQSGQTSPPRPYRHSLIWQVGDPLKMVPFMQPRCPARRCQRRIPPAPSLLILPV
ncbi:hypothetical protein BC940DRAFT_1480 [Gongronella butleri]|nr:hypothetical protein BC940DRAFT_1480 [Gongronella butleri]